MPTKRAGILTQAAFLTRWSHDNQTSPVHRGKLMRFNVMCGNVPPPPVNVNTNATRADARDVDAAALRAAFQRPDLRRRATS